MCLKVIVDRLHQHDVDQGRAAWTAVAVPFCPSLITLPVVPSLNPTEKMGGFIWFLNMLVCQNHCFPYSKHDLFQMIFGPLIEQAHPLLLPISGTTWGPFATPRRDFQRASCHLMHVSRVLPGCLGYFFLFTLEDESARQKYYMSLSRGFEPTFPLFLPRKPTIAPMGN